nr:hypothetical protein [uncultured Arsenicibacter sp.]
MKKVILAASLLATLTISQSFAQDQPRREGRRDSTNRGGGRGGMMRDMAQVEEKDLPQSIKDYVKKEFSAAEFRRAGKNTEGQYMVMMTEGEKRLMLTFDEKGVFVSKREMQGRPGGGGNGGGQRNK